jgi:hypothetical protein
MTIVATTALLDFMRDDLESGDVPVGVEALVHELRRRYPRALRAVLLYGSCRRKQDAYEGLVDLLVLVSSYRDAHVTWAEAIGNAVLPPNVYYLEAETACGRVRCKYAVIRIDAFQRRCEGGLDAFFWARFTQPARLVWAFDTAAREAVAVARAAAAHAFASRAAALQQGTVGCIEFWQQALSASYGCELRPESPGAAASLIASEPAYWRRLSALVGSDADTDRRLRSTWRLRARAGWGPRRVWGKLLNILRLFKAAGTFTNGIDYLLWKAERHSGIRVEATEHMRRHPRRSAWRLAWQLWRQGAFR